MPFAVEDFRDLIELLDKRPDLRAQVRALVLTDDVLSLPSAINKLVETQQRTEERLGDLTRRIDQLAERFDQLTERMDQLTARVEQLGEAQRRTEVHLGELADAQRRTEERLGDLATRVGTLNADLRGDKMERKYRLHAPAYFGRILRRAHVLSAEELDALLPEEGELITEEERNQLLVSDIVIRGKERSTQSEAYLAVEVSALVDLKDVRRARERAAILEKVTGKRAMPVVAGEDITEDAKRLIAADRVWCVLDGRATQGAPA
jgi:chromosome segregation ATPase